MIQFNLLPDVKVEYLKAEHARKLITIGAIAVTTASLVFLGIVFSINLYKSNNLKSLSAEIDKSSKELKEQSEINRKLTVQNQLTSITSLHDAKPEVGRLFEYLNQLTPSKVVSITNIEVDFVTSVVSIKGTADSLVSVNKYVDTLKFTKYNTKNNSEQVQAFSDVVLTTFSYTTPDTQAGATTDQPATYLIDFKYDPKLFNITESVKLQVPNIITTRSAADAAKAGQQSDLFRPAPNPADDGGSQ